MLFSLFIKLWFLLCINMRSCIFDHEKVSLCVYACQTNWIRGITNHTWGTQKDHAAERPDSWLTVILGQDKDLIRSIKTYKLRKKHKKTLKSWLLIQSNKFTEPLTKLKIVKTANQVFNKFWNMLSLKWMSKTKSTTRKLVRIKYKLKRATLARSNIERGSRVM